MVQKLHIRYRFLHIYIIRIFTKKTRPQQTRSSRNRDPVCSNRRDPLLFDQVLCLFDDFQSLAVDRESNEDQEDHALDQLLGRRVIPHHDQSVVKDRIHQRTDNDIGKTDLRPARDRQAAQHQGDQDLGLQLVPCGRGDGSP